MDRRIVGEYTWLIVDLLPKGDLSQISLKGYFVSHFVWIYFWLVNSETTNKGLKSALELEYIYTKAKAKSNVVSNI